MQAVPQNSNPTQAAAVSHQVDDDQLYGPGLLHQLMLVTGPVLYSACSNDPAERAGAAPSPIRSFLGSPYPSGILECRAAKE